MLVIERHIRLSRPLDLHQTLGPLQRGSLDPCMRFEGDTVWRASRTPDGTSTVRLEVVGDELRTLAWGDGAAWASEHALELVGEHQDDASFETDHPVVRELHRRYPGLRVCKSNAVTEVLVPTILEQRVTGREAKYAYRRIVRRFSVPAPGPFERHGLLLPPEPGSLAAMPYWAFHPYGIERKRADALRRACAAASKMEAALTIPSPIDAQKRLMAVPGVGPWSAAEVALTALGDADAVIVGDFHLHNWVAWSLAGEPRGDDDRMIELLEPFRGQRGRVMRLIAASGNVPPKYGPRYNPIPIASL